MIKYMVEFSNINKKDLKILQALDQDVRASYAQIGRKTGLSKEVVQYRIKQLEKKKILTSYWAIPSIGNNSKVYKLLIKNKSLGKTKKEEFIKYVLSQKAVSWIASTEGYWDFVISSFITKDSAFSNLVNNILKRFGKYFKEKRILKSTSMIITNEKYLYDNNNLLFNEEDNFIEESKSRDEKDNKIIRILSSNARASFTEIAKQVDLTAEAVAVRFKRIMREKLIIRANPRINHNKLGLSYYHIFISVSDYNKKNEICMYYTQHPNFVFIMKHIGYYDIHLELVIKEGRVETIIEELTEKFGEAISSYDLLKIRKEYIISIMR